MRVTRVQPRLENNAATICNNCAREGLFLEKKKTLISIEIKRLDMNLQKFQWSDAAKQKNDFSCFTDCTVKPQPTQRISDTVTRCESNSWGHIFPVVPLRALWSCIPWSLRTNSHSSWWELHTMQVCGWNTCESCCTVITCVTEHVFDTENKNAMHSSETLGISFK